MKSITLNDSTVKSLKRYLKRFPDNAELSFIDGSGKRRRLTICCNTDRQKELNEVMVQGGFYK